MLLYSKSTTNERWYDSPTNFFLLHFYNIRLYWTTKETVSTFDMKKATPDQVKLLIKVIFNADEFDTGRI